MLWKCDTCGCQGIAASLTTCPMCGKEREMPKTTAGGGPSNADAQPGEPGYVKPDKPAKPAAKPASKGE